MSFFPYSPFYRDIGSAFPRFVARTSAYVTALIVVPAAEQYFLPPTPFALRFLPCPLRVEQSLQKHPLPRRLSPSMPLPRRALHKEPIPPRSLIRSRPTLRRWQPAPNAWRPSGRISTRARLRTATATVTAPPAVDSGSGPGGAPRLSARRANTPPRVRRPRPPLAVVAAPVPAASPVPTVPIPPDRGRAERATSLYYFRPRLAYPPPQRPTSMSLELLLNYSSEIPPRVVRTLTGGGSNRPSPRATLPCATLRLAGRRPCQPNF